ncbi:MAG: sialidase family protein [Planctomycetota bacterium]|nr:sialidase family protein [Planctomycetota bacterium]
MHIVNRSVVYDASQFGEAGRIAFFDSVIPLKSGTWLSGFTTGKSKHHHQGTIRLSRSVDGGASWSVLPWKFQTAVDGVPGSLAGAEMVETKSGRLLLFSTWFDRSDPDRPLFDPETEGILRSRQLMAVSTDEGESWSDWSVVPTRELTGCAMTGPVVKWPDGTLAFAFESFKEFDDPKPARHGAWLLVSRDDGETFDTQFLVGRDPQHEVYYWDQRICPGPSNGDFVAMFWTHDRAKKQDLRVHFLRASLTDGDRAANEPVETTIRGQIAAAVGRRSHFGVRGGSRSTGNDAVMAVC